MYNKENVLIRFLYGTCAGRILLKIFTKPELSNIVRKFLDSSLSKAIIPFYIKKHGIDMSEYKTEEYSSFNSFFIRKKENIDIDRDTSILISPCDGYLSVYNIDSVSRYNIKNCEYDLSQLLGESFPSEIYNGGKCFVFRLEPQNYHRYCYIDDGYKNINKDINGILHCVRPAACDKYPVYVQNTRTYTQINTVNFGKVIQMEIGAMLVGRIHNHEHGEKEVFKGEEKGYFEFGGSTILMLFEKNKVVPYVDIVLNTAEGRETQVRAGESIGEKVKGDS